MLDTKEKEVALEKIRDTLEILVHSSHMHLIPDEDLVECALNSIKGLLDF
ncbi:hypothetical protein [Leptospira weilii]|nr:hypothetical protein [Leptospira weilii]